MSNSTTSASGAFRSSDPRQSSCTLGIEWSRATLFHFAQNRLGAVRCCIHSSFCHATLTKHPAYVCPHTRPKGRASCTPACNSTAFHDHKYPTRACTAWKRRACRRRALSSASNSLGIYPVLTHHIPHALLPRALPALARRRPSPPIPAHSRPSPPIFKDRIGALITRRPRHDASPPPSCPRLALGAGEHAVPILPRRPDVQQARPFRPPWHGL